MSSSQPADRAVGAVPVDHPEGSTSPTPLPSGSAAAGAHRPSEDCSQPADERVNVIEAGYGAHWYVWEDDERGIRTARDAVDCPVCAAQAALAAVAAEQAELREALERAIVYVKNMEMPDTGVIGPGGEREHDYHEALLHEEVRKWEAALSRGAAP